MGKGQEAPLSSDQHFLPCTNPPQQIFQVSLSLQQRLFNILSLKMQRLLSLSKIYAPGVSNLTLFAAFFSDLGLTLIYLWSARNFASTETFKKKRSSSEWFQSGNNTNPLSWQGIISQSWRQRNNYRKRSYFPTFSSVGLKYPWKVLEMAWK